MNEQVTTVICARNAESTIARAVRSALQQGGPVLLVDDFSDDRTVAVARSVAGDALRVVRPEVHRTLGYARSVGVAAVATDWLMWLDADDELLSGRAARLLAAARVAGADAVWDAAELYDGASGRLIRQLPMPAFMLRPGAAVRLFERNFTPGPAWPLVRTALARKVGYNPELPTADDLDFMLRAQGEGENLLFLDTCGYRQYAYPTSLSRNLVHQRNWVAQVLRRHDYEEVRRRYLDSGYGERVAAWGVVSLALFRDEPAAALHFIDDACPPGADPAAVLEPLGPVPEPEGWRRDFGRGACLLLLGRYEGAECALRAAEARVPTAEGANNLGVAVARLGCRAEAEGCWRSALVRFPGFADARENLAGAASLRITTHPLRRQASRGEYPMG